VASSPTSSQWQLTGSASVSGGELVMTDASGGSASVVLTPVFNVLGTDTARLEFDIDLDTSSAGNQFQSGDTFSWELLDSTSTVVQSGNVAADTDNITTNAVAAGSYRLRYTLADNTATKTAEVRIDDIKILTLTAATLVTQTAVASGNVLSDQMNLVASSDPWGAVDDKGAEGAVLSVWNGASYVDATNAGVSVAGSYGSLLLMSSGAYVYTPTASLANVGQQETFTYQLKQADGDTDTAHLVIKVASSAYVAPTVINGTESNDPSLNGTAGDDIILAKAGDDVVHGLGGTDHIEGGVGNDSLYGDAGNDFLLGGLDDDFLFGGLGNDSLVGGSGADTFVWQAGDSGTDVVADFLAGTDTLDLSALLDGEHSAVPGSLETYLTFSFGVTTTITADSNGTAVLGGDIQVIQLAGADLAAHYGGASAATVIAGMLADDSLLVAA
jgi:VCBS repeat-containing protein